MGSSFSDISIGFLIFALILLIYIYYDKKNENSRNDLLKSSFTGLIRGFFTGFILGGIEPGLVVGLTTSIINPIIHHIDKL